VAKKRRNKGPKIEDVPATTVIEKHVVTVAVVTKEESSPKKKHKSKKKRSLTEASSSMRPRIASGNKFLGAHLSVAGGLHHALLQARELGANACAIFTRNQRTWKSKPLETEDISLWKQTMTETGMQPRHVLPHGSYLINLCSPEPELLDKSRHAFLEELSRCQALGIPKYNFHPGSGRGQQAVEHSCKVVAESINWAMQRSSGVMAVLENTAGGGSTLGRTFEELKQIIDGVDDKSRVGVCIDTCHLFAAGYDISTEAGYTKAMSEFDRIVGFKYLAGMHLNDSKTPCGSRLDRHENIGKGTLGLTCFQSLMNDPRLSDVPLILETPATDYAKEIALLRSFQKL
jgi:deoxyribonuclease-4